MREKISLNEEKSGAAKFLYRNKLGRGVLKILVRPWVSKTVGRFMDSRLSKPMIKSFIKKNGIDLNDYLGAPYKNYNDFFTRKIKDGRRIFDMSPAALCAPCDSALSVYPITSGSLFSIKGGSYSCAALLGDGQLAEQFERGTCLVFRLAVTDYHRYSFFDSGKTLSTKYIPGVFHTVRPVALERYDFYKENSRSVTVMETENFGTAAFVEVGALLVGKIKNHPVSAFSKGEEKGYFEFGGSTCVLLLKESAAKIDDEILANTAAGFESKVRLGERIGERY